jgi:putative endonuclease
MPLFDSLRRLFRKERTPGERGERIAEKHLKKQGYKRIARNLRIRAGEIDLLMLDPDGRTLVFVEVKTARADRRSSVPPEVRVGKQKQRKIVVVAMQIIKRYKLTGRPARFDIVGVSLHHDRPAEVRHYANAFQSPW